MLILYGVLLYIFREMLTFCMCFLNKFNSMVKKKMGNQYFSLFGGRDTLMSLWQGAVLAFHEACFSIGHYF